MKKIALFSIVAALIFIGSCKKALPDIEFTKEFANIDFVLQPSDTIGDFDLMNQTFNTDIINKLNEEEFNINNLKEVKLESAVLQIVDSNPDLNFDFLRDVNASLESNTTFIFANVQLPASFPERTINLNPSTSDLKVYFKNDQLTVKLRAYLELPITQVTACRLSLRFKIKAGI